MLDQVAELKFRWSAKVGVGGELVVEIAAVAVSIAVADVIVDYY